MSISEDGSSVVFTSSLATRGAVGNLSAFAATNGVIDTLDFIPPRYRARVVSGSMPSRPTWCAPTCLHYPDRVDTIEDRD